MAMKSDEDTSKKTLATWGKGHCHQDKNDGNQGDKDSGEQVVVMTASIGTLRTQKIATPKKMATSYTRTWGFTEDTKRANRRG